MYVYVYKNILRFLKLLVKVLNIRLNYSNICTLARKNILYIPTLNISDKSYA